MIKKIAPEIFGFMGPLIISISWWKELIGLAFAIVGYFLARGLYRLFKDRFESWVDSIKEKWVK